MCIVWFIILLYFFFKQKTAYESRISDWSSDVCSSDLAEDRRQRGSAGLGRARCRSWRILYRTVRASSPVWWRERTGYRHCLYAEWVCGLRSEVRRGGKGCVSRCRSRWAPEHGNKKHKHSDSQKVQCSELIIK